MTENISIVTTARKGREGKNESLESTERRRVRSGIQPDGLSDDPLAGLWIRKLLLKWWFWKARAGKKAYLTREASCGKVGTMTHAPF